MAELEDAKVYLESIAGCMSGMHCGVEAVDEQTALRLIQADRAATARAALSALLTHSREVMGIRVVTVGVIETYLDKYREST